MSRASVLRHPLHHTRAEVSSDLHLENGNIRGYCNAYKVVFEFFLLECSGSPVIKVIITASVKPLMKIKFGRAAPVSDLCGSVRVTDPVFLFDLLLMYVVL